VCPRQCAPGRNRTCDLGIRRPLLYPTELRRRRPESIWWAGGDCGLGVLGVRPHVLTGYAVSGIGTSSTDRLATSLAAQRSDKVLQTALRSTYGGNYCRLVTHPLNPHRTGRPGLIPTGRLQRRYSGTASDMAYRPVGRHNLLDIWRRPDVPIDVKLLVLVQVPGGGWAFGRQTRPGVSADESDGRTRLGLCIYQLQHKPGQRLGRRTWSTSSGRSPGYE
jgi:hypothetical protein